MFKLTVRFGRAEAAASSGPMRLARLDNSVASLGGALAGSVSCFFHRSKLMRRWPRRVRDPRGGATKHFRVRFRIDADCSTGIP